MADSSVLQTRLAEAEAALHKLITGAQAVQVNHEGFDVTYTRSSEAALRRYIIDLKRQLGASLKPRARRVNF